MMQLHYMGHMGQPYIVYVCDYICLLFNTEVTVHIAGMIPRGDGLRVSQSTLSPWSVYQVTRRF